MVVKSKKPAYFAKLINLLELSFPTSP